MPIPETCQLTDMVRNLLLVGLGGAVGAVLRWLISLAIPTQSFPWATLIINITGSFCIGIIFGLVIQQQLSDQGRLFLATGLCGGFTTFSAFSLETVGLLQSGKTTAALAYVLASVVIGIAMSWLGIKLIQS
jgi:CrcB protein